MKSLLKNLVIFLGLAVILYAGYNFFFAGGSVALDVGGGTSQGEMLTQQFLIRLNEIKGIDFSQELFDDPRFRSLFSFSTAPETTSAGRVNPFSP